MLIDFNSEYNEESPAPDVLESRFSSLLASDRFWAILAGDPAVAFATVAERDSPLYDGRVGYLEDLYVRPKLRGHGIGGGVMRMLLDEAHRRGLGLVEIGVDEPDVDAMRFYESHGFVHRDPDTGDRAFHIYQELA